MRNDGIVEEESILFIYFYSNNMTEKRRNSIYDVVQTPYCIQMRKRFYYYYEFLQVTQIESLYQCDEFFNIDLYYGDKFT